MELIQILSAEAVLAQFKASSKKRLFQEIAQIADSVYGLPSQALLKALQDREILGPTGMGNGVAVPHARLDCIEDVKGVFIRLDKPIEYESIDRQPVDLAFALFAPEGAGAEHLKALARVSRLLRDDSICSKLRSSEDPNALFAIITDAQASKAA